MQIDLKQVTTILQKFIDEHMNDKLIVIRSKNKSFDVKMDTLEWLSRYANFYNPENVYLVLSAFKEIYNGNDINYRNAYVSTDHTSDTAFILVNQLKGELAKILTGGSSPSSNGQVITKNLTGQVGVMQSSENKASFYLNLLEPLLVNDLNNEISIATGIIETIV